MQAPLQSRNDSNAAQMKTAESVAQTRGLTNNRLEGVVQRKLAAIMNNSPRVLQQRALRDAFHNSPRMMAQHALFGGAVNPQGDAAIPAEASPAQREEKRNNTGLPNQLKLGIESLSGISMDHVKVHYNSDKPAQLQAHAYAQGSEIYLGAGQEGHLPHEAWHVVQQTQGRVRPTFQMKADAVNDDPSLEGEADRMGEKAAQFEDSQVEMNLAPEESAEGGLTQRIAGFVQLPLQQCAYESTVTKRLGALHVSANVPVIQAMFTLDGIRFTQNAEYGIAETNPEQLLVNSSASAIQPLTHFKQNGSVEKEVALPEISALENEGGPATDRLPIKVSFNIFESGFVFGQQAKYPNDCGMYAQALALNQPGWDHEKTAGEHLNGLERKVQYDPSDSSSSDNLSLEPGNAYRIDWDDANLKPLEKCSHHVATVVAKDGEDHVTSEAHAGRKDIEKPVFDMYGTTKNTFWQHHRDDFTLHLKDSLPKLPFVTKYQKKP